MRPEQNGNFQHKSHPKFDFNKFSFENMNRVQGDQLLRLQNKMMMEMFGSIQHYIPNSLELKNYQEPRFFCMEFNIPVLKKQNDEKTANKIKIFCSDLCRQIIEKGFQWFEQKRIPEKMLRQFFCNNFLANIIKFAYLNNLSDKQIKLIDQHLKKEVFIFLKERYPQSQSSPNKKFQKLITLIDNFDSNQNDQVFRSGIKFQYKKNGDYSAEIMKFINWLIFITHEQKQEDVKFYNLFQNQMENIFKKVQNKKWMISFMKGVQEEKVNLSQTQKQKHLKIVKQYTKYNINQKISDNIQPFNQNQIKESNLLINDPGIMRIIAKWCQELEKYFEIQNIINREERFRMANGTERYLKFQFRQRLYEELHQQDKKRRQFLQEVKNNIYKNHEKMLSQQEFFATFRSFSSKDQGMVGLFTTVMNKSYQNYLISYLNKLIHCIVCAEKKMKQSYPKNQQYKFATHLVSFKIGDLFRCRCSSRQQQIIALYKYLKNYCQKNKEVLELIRLKNRLNEGSKDILINLRFHKKLVVQMQLLIDQDTSNFITCSNKLNHFFYEIIRAPFGPISEISSLYNKVDPRANYFHKKFQQIQVKISTKKQQQICMNHELVQTSLPVWCSQCRKFSSTLNMIIKHKRCKECWYGKCWSCRIQNKQTEEVKKNGIKLNLDELFNETQKLIRKKIKLIDLKKKYYKQSCLYIAYYHYKIVLIEQRQENKLSVIGHAKNKRQLQKMFTNKLIINQLEVDKQDNINVINAIITQLLTDAIKKKRIFFLFQNQTNEQSFLDKQVIQTVQVLNLTSTNIKSINPLMKVFPNAKIALLQKNKIASLEGISVWKKINQLNLQRNKLSSIPNEIWKLQNLQILIINNNEIKQFPEQICHISNLKRLNYRQNYLANISPNIKNLKKLEILKLSKNNIRQMPVGLMQLDLSQNAGLTLPQSLNIPNLRQLNLQKNGIEQIPVGFFTQMKQLQKLFLQGNKIKIIPESLKHKQKLSIIGLSYNLIHNIPDFLFQLPKLKAIYLNNNIIQQFQVPQLIQKFTIQELNLLQNKFKTIPPTLNNISTLNRLMIGHKIEQKIEQNEVINLDKLQNLRQLNIINMGMVKIPDYVLKLKKIQILSFDNNLISQIQEQIVVLEKCLVSLYISDNRFEIFPKNVLKLHLLQKLGLNNNKLKQIPQQIKVMVNLEKLMIQGEQLETIPEQVIKLPYLRKLWISESSRIKTDVISKMKKNKVDEKILTTIQNQLKNGPKK